MTIHRTLRVSAWIASLVLALPLCAQDVPATPPTDAAATEAAPAQVDDARGAVRPPGSG